MIPFWSCGLALFIFNTAHINHNICFSTPAIVKSLPCCLIQLRSGSNCHKLRSTLWVPFTLDNVSHKKDQLDSGAAHGNEICTAVSLKWKEALLWCHSAFFTSVNQWLIYYESSNIFIERIQDSHCLHKNYRYVQYVFQKCLSNFLQCIQTTLPCFDREVGQC